MSVLSYLIPLWGGCEGYLVKVLQVLQNRAARQVTKHSWFTPTRRLLKECNWLSIRQLVHYRIVLMVYRSIKSGTPLYLHQHLSTDPDHHYPTRLASSGSVYLQGRHGGLVQKSFLVRAAQDYNNIPASIRSCSSFASFKVQLKKWIKTNVPLD